MTILLGKVHYSVGGGPHERWPVLLAAQFQAHSVALAAPTMWATQWATQVLPVALAALNNGLTTQKTEILTDV